MFKAFNPWDDITTPEALTALLGAAGGPAPAAEAARARHELEGPWQFWEVVLGSGYRATIEALTGEQREEVRERTLSVMRSQQVTELCTDVVFGTARSARPGGAT